MRQTRRLSVAIAAALTVGLLAACSSSGGGTSSNQSTDSSPATTTGSTSGSASASVEAAKAYIAKVEQFPTEIGGALPPLNSTPAEGKTIAYLQCEVSGCNILGKALSVAAAAAHWKFRAIPFQSGNPATLVAGLKQALTFGVDAVALSGIPYALWSSVVPDYQKAGVPIITSYIGPGVPINKTTPAQIANTENSNYWGDIMANYVTATSDGKAHLLELNIPAFSNINAIAVEMNSKFKTICPDCDITKTDATIAQVDAGSIDNLIVSQLQKNPSINYVWVGDISFAPGLPAALAAAGLKDKVKIIAGSITAAAAQQVQDGSLAAPTTNAFSISSWLTFDAALRAVQGMDVPPAGGVLPTVLITKDNVGKYPLDQYNDLQVPSTYQQQFLKLWKLSS